MKKKYFIMNGLLAFVLFSFINLNNASAQLYINEFVASNDLSFPGPQGDHPDWIEIYNAGSEDVMLGGYFMSDVLTDPDAMFEIPSTYPDSVTVPAGGFILFYANKGQESSVLNLNFKLGGSGEQIGLWNSAQEVIDTLTYGGQISDVSFGRMPDGSNQWQSFVEHDEMGFTATPGRSNITLKINELLAKNDNNIVDEFGNHGDWIELYNYGINAVDVSGLHMSDLVDDPLLYTFNPMLIPSEGYLLVWCDGTDVDEITVPDTLHANFKLGAGGETVSLSLNANAIIDVVTFGAQTADISYGRYPNGSDNWMSFTIPTPRESNTLAAGAVISSVVREPLFPEFTDEVVITANVTSAETGLTVTLKYDAGQGYIDVAMLDGGGDTFTGAIPALEKGTYVDWYIEAVDDAPSTTYYPSEGSAAPLSYRITDWSPTEVYEMPINEPSGLAYNALTETLFTNNDGNVSNIYEISTTADLLNTLNVNGTDFEGIAFSVNYDTIFVVEEANWKVIMLDLVGNIIGEIQVEHNPGQVDGLEGITVDPLTRHLFVLGEKNEPQLIELTVDGVEVFRTELDFSSDVSGITIHPVWNTLFIISDEAYSLNEVTKKGKFLRSWYIPLDQAEGVTFGENEHLIYMVADRGGKLYKFDFNFDPYVPPASLFINEFMASNDTTVPGPQGDHPDWIEIYNAGDEDIMLGGYYMSDILTDPNAMYQIPSTYPDSVTVAAGGFIVFYANKGETSSVLNLNFKLSAGGEQIGLWNPDQLIIDNLTYEAQTTDVSFGRYLDGTEDWYFMNDFSPGEANRYVDAIYENELDVSLKQNYPNPFSSVTNIEFDLEKPNHVSVTVFDITGTVVAVLADNYYSKGKQTIQWNASGLPAGYYFYRIEISNASIVKKAMLVK